MIYDDEHPPRSENNESDSDSDSDEPSSKTTSSSGEAKENKYDGERPDHIDPDIWDIMKEAQWGQQSTPDVPQLCLDMVRQTSLSNLPEPEQSEVLDACINQNDKEVSEIMQDSP